MAINVHDFEAIARQKMEPSAYDYYAGGADDEQTLIDNCAAFARIVFRPRVLVGAEQVDTSTTVLGHALPFPVLLAPTAFNRLGHPDGEVAVARAAGAAGTIMCASTIASSTLEEIADAAPEATRWFQVYIYRDRAVTSDLVRRAEAAGYTALVLTVDTPRLGRRERDVRNGFTLPPGMSIRNLEVSGRKDAARWSGTSSFTQYVHDLLDPSLTWGSVDWLRSITTLPIVVKGVLSPHDAVLAITHGAAGVIVSNHGGRQLDGSIATIDALPDIVDAVDRRIPVLIDGGIRRGTDVLKSLALGASAVLIGRAYLWALAAEGELGVTKVLEMLRSELELAMALAGTPTVQAITRELVVPRPSL